MGKKIIYLHQYFYTPESNGGTRSFDLARSFVKNGYEVLVITSVRYSKKDVKDVYEKYGIYIRSMGLPYSNNYSYLYRIFFFVSYIVYASFLLLKERCNLVLATSTPLTIGIPAIFKKVISKTPFVFEVRDVWPEVVVAMGVIKNKFLVKLLSKLEEVIYDNSAFIVPLSIDMKKSIITRFPNFKSKIPFVIPNISEINRFQNESTKIPSNNQILYAGTFGKVNDLIYIVDLTNKIVNYGFTNFKVILVGDGVQKRFITDYAESLDLLGSYIYIKDAVRKSELPSLYNSVTYGSSFVAPIPELWANSANKFFDSLAAARPVLINYEGWQADYIRNNNVGYVLPSDLNNFDVEDFVNYLQNDNIKRQQSVNCLNCAIQDFSLEVSVSKYFHIFKKVLNK